jgi:hypothetical protein
VVSNYDPKAAQILGEDRSASCKRDLRQQPEGMEKRRITRSCLQTGLGGFRGQSSYRADPCAKPQLIDDLTPLSRLRQHAESYMAHDNPPQGRLSSQPKMRKRTGVLPRLRLAHTVARQRTMLIRKS